MIEEIKNYLTISRDKSIVIDNSISDCYMGFVRKITVFKDLSVSIEFNDYGYDEGGIEFEGNFKSLEELCSAMEEYLGSAVDDWINFSATGEYPKEPENIGLIRKESRDKLDADIKAASVSLPVEGNFIILGSQYVSLWGSQA